MDFFGTFDIETIPSQSLPEDCIPKFNESEVALGNLKDPVKIDAKLTDAKAKFEANLSKAMGTDPDLCMIVSFCGHDTGNGIWPGTDSEVARNETDERKIICSGIDFIENCFAEEMPVVTFNGASFDIPVLIRRAMYLDIHVRTSTIEKLTSRRDANRYHIDLMQALAVRSPFSGKPECKSLEYYLNRFGLGSKTPGMDGSMVYPLWLEEKYDEIAAYNRDDVLRTSELFDRVSPWLYLLAREIEREKINTLPAKGYQNV